jgi:hypothetical protein
MSAPTIGNTRKNPHFEEIVRDGDDGYIVGCQCGWTCSGHADNIPFAVRIWMIHFAALESRRLA